MRLVSVDLESLLALEHKARLFWSFVGRLDLSKFYGAIDACEHTPGRPPPDPRIMVTLWLYAYSENVGSARRLDELCRRDDAYRWICGGVSMNYHSLASFRVGHSAALEDLMAQVLASLSRQGFLDFERIAQDGLRVRASAGGSSFHRQQTIEKCLHQAKELVAQVKKSAEASDSQRTSREQAAQTRAAREREERLQRAQEELKKIQAGQEAQRKRKGKDAPDPKQARVSTTDPEARVMMLPGGAFRPGYNLQLATDVKSRLVVGVQVSNSASDTALMSPMLEHLQEKYGRLPKQHLVDGGYVNDRAFAQAEKSGVTVYAPVRRTKDHPDPYAQRRSSSATMNAWRARMGTPEAKEIYKLRASTAELTNAHLRFPRALDRLLVRGLQKVKSVVLWAVLSLNLHRWAKLQPA
jgi:transposase